MLRYVPTRIVVLALFAAAFVSSPASSQEGSGEFACRASATAVNAGIFAEPVVANPSLTPCTDDTAHAAFVLLPGAPASGVPGLGMVQVLEARTEADAEQASATASASSVLITLGDTTITADVLESRSETTCDPVTGTPSFSGSANVVNLVVDGQPVTVAAEPNTVIPADNDVFDIVVNQQLQFANALIVWALVIDGPPGITITVARSDTGFFGNPCI